MQNLILLNEEFTKEKQVVMEERRTRVEDEPISTLDEHFRATAFQTSPYQHPIIGWASDIENLTLTDLQTWYQRWYTPNNATVIVVGDVEPQNVLTLAKQYFGPLKPRELTPPIARPEIEQLGIKRLVVKKPAKLPHLIMGYHVPSMNTLPKENYWEAYALELLAYILDGGTSARLTKNLVRGQQIASSVSVSYDPFSRLTDLFTFNSVPTEKHTPAELKTAILQQIKQLQTTPVTEKELTRVKNQLRASKVYELDSQFYQGMQIGILTSVGLDWHILDNYLDNIKTISAQQIQTVANKYLITDKLTFAVLEPLPLKTSTPITSPQPTSGMIH
jgi:zinc protease